MAFNIEVRDIFEKLYRQLNMQEGKQGYGKTAFNGVLHHNDRHSRLKGLMHKFGQVEKQLKTQNYNEKVMFERMEQEDEMKEEDNAGGEELKLEQ
jgi:hypothetical protein